MAFSCKQLIFFGLVVVLTVAYQVRAMPPIQPAQVLLLSEKSGRFVSVASGGVVTAQALRSGKVLAIKRVVYSLGFIFTRMA